LAAVDPESVASLTPQLDNRLTTLRYSQLITCGSTDSENTLISSYTTFYINRIRF